MKKKWVTAFVTGILATSVLAMPSFADNSSNVHLNLNGVDVTDTTAHWTANDYVFSSVAFFAKYYSATYQWNPSTNTLTLNGQTVSNQYGNPQQYQGVLTASLRAMTEALGADHSEIGFDSTSSTVNASVLPTGVVPLQGHFVVPQMGEHWADPKNLPLGPIYGLYNGKLVFLEYMPGQNLDKTIHDVPGTTVPIPAKIDHMDLDWNPQGHPGYLEPHYDVHLYFISRAEQNQIGAGDASSTGMDMGMGSGTSTTGSGSATTGTK